MQTDILTERQVELLPIVKYFGAQGYYLVGGTALALQLGHRRSIDFDFFTNQHFDNNEIIERIEKLYPIEQMYINQTDQLTVITHGVQMTWYRYTYKIPLAVEWESHIKMPDPLTIGAMKAFALGQRAKWKDYVDLYFLFKQYDLKTISKKAEELFGLGLYDEALFRGQLSYYVGIDYRELPEYMPGFEVSDEEIKKTLADIACTE